MLLARRFYLGDLSARRGFLSPFWRLHKKCTLITSSLSPKRGGRNSILRASGVFAKGKNCRREAWRERDRQTGIQAHIIMFDWLVGSLFLGGWVIACMCPGGFEKTPRVVLIVSF